MLNENDRTLHDILETVTFIKDNGVTRKELREDLAAQKSDLLTVMDTKLGVLEDRLTAKFEQRLTEKTSEVITHVDAFAALHQKLDQELTALRGKYNRLEERLVRVEQQLAIQVA